MSLTIGDLALSFANRASNVRIRTEMNTLSQELTTGLKSDYRTPLAGDLAPVAVIERSLSNLAAYKTAINETGTFLSAAQSILGQVGGVLTDLAGAAFDMENTSNPSLIANFGKQAADRFDSLITALNSTIGGRAVFSGNETDTQPIDLGALILDDLEASLPPAAGVVEIVASIDAYFAPGGGFDAGRYKGGTTPLSPLRLSPTDTAQFGVTAQSDEIRSALAATAKAAILDRGALTGDTAAQGDLIRAAGLDLVGADARIVNLRGNLGVLENRVETARTRNATETQALALARNDIVAADPFETATQLQSVQVQLETFYTLTARLSQLNLTGFLR